MNVDPILEARQLIEAERYFEAQTLLASLNSSDAAALLRKLDTFLDQPHSTTFKPPHVARPRIEGTAFFCERCGRKSGAEMARCDNRAADQCIYALQQDAGHRIGVMLVGFAVFGCFFGIPLMAALNTPSISPFSVLFILPFLAVGVTALAFALHSLFGSKTALVNPTTGFAWYKLSILGLPLEQTVTLGIEPQQLNFTMIPTPDLPLSVLALKAENDVFLPHPAANLAFSAALLGLIQRGVLWVGRPNLHRSTLGSKPHPVHQPDYVLMLSTASPIEGALEQRIVTAMTRWQGAGKSSRRGGMTLFDICRALYDGETYTNSYSWLLDIVRQDATARGVGIIQPQKMQLGPFRSSVERYEPSVKMQHYAAQIEAAVKAFEQANGDFGRRFKFGVMNGLSRMDPSD